MAISKKIHIDAMQTIAPSEVTAPEKLRRTNLTNTSLSQNSLQNRFQMVLYYKKSSEEESVWKVAAQVKESLNVALSDWPELAGRLRKEGEVEGYWAIKYNDAGVRLVHASVEISLEEFLEMEDRVTKEAALADWVQIDLENPNFSALFYIQLTKFKCNGYAIGIACSLLLADPLSLIRFLKSWSQTHIQMISNGRLSEPPMFHFGYFQSPILRKHLKSISLDSSSSLTSPSIVNLFKAPRTSYHEDVESYKNIATSCFGEALAKTGIHGISKFSIIVNDLDRLEIELFENDTDKYTKYNAEPVKWDELGMRDFTLVNGNKPIIVSYAIISCEDEGLVVVMKLSDQVEDSSDIVSGTIISKN